MNTANTNLNGEFKMASENEVALNRDMEEAAEQAKMITDKIKIIMETGRLQTPTKRKVLTEIHAELEELNLYLFDNYGI